MHMLCEICEHPFDTFTDASSHYRNEHHRHSITPRCCQRKIRLSSIRSHIQYHLNPDEFKCVQCGQACIAKASLDAHLKTHREKFECDICKKKISSKEHVLRHILKEHVKRQGDLECEICKKRFVLKNDISYHMKQAHARPYDRVCHICAKVFISDTMLTEHLKTHKDPNALRVACEFCGKYFAKTLYLRAHVRSMHEEDGVTHKCPECHKKFTKSLNNHIRYHHNFKSHKCNICAKVCKSRHDLKEHTAIHTGKYLYTCYYCPQKFKANANRHKHCKRMHPFRVEADREARLANERSE